MTLSLASFLKEESPLLILLNLWFINGVKQEDLQYFKQVSEEFYVKLELYTKCQEWVKLFTEAIPSPFEEEYV